MKMPTSPNAPVSPEWEAIDFNQGVVGDQIAIFVWDDNNELEEYHRGSFVGSDIVSADYPPTPRIWIQTPGIEGRRLSFRRHRGYKIRVWRKIEDRITLKVNGRDATVIQSALAFYAERRAGAIADETMAVRNKLAVQLGEQER